MNRKLIILLGFFLLSLTFEAQNIKLVFRFDDFRLTSDALNEGVVRVFQKHHIPLVLGVVPCDSKEKEVFGKNYAFLPELKKGIQNQSVEIAQHGLNHIQISHDGEFGNVPITEQYRRMKKGKAVLESILNKKIVTFIPPYNAYDNNTLTAMEQTGFIGISSQLFTGQSWNNSHIQYFPRTLEDFGILMPVLEHNKNRKGIVVVMFHPYTFTKSLTLSQLDSLLTSVNKLSYVKCITFSQLYSSMEVSDRKRMEANLEINFLSKFLHLNGVIQTTAFTTLIRVVNVLLYLVLSAFFFLLSVVLFYRKKKLSKRRKYSVGSILWLIVGLSVWFHFLGPLKLILIIPFVSVFISLGLTIQFKNNFLST